MTEKTKIEWCDSTTNLQMGCNGCELWTPTVQACYAGTQTARYAGMNGWPSAFETPMIFPQRVAVMGRWRNLTGSVRPEKPWLDKLPRMIFLNDMGDTFTEDLPIDWLAPYHKAMAAMPHWFMILTKRPKRAVQYWHKFREDSGNKMPENFYMGASVTSQANVQRAADLAAITDRPLFLSIEPLLGPVKIPADTLRRYRMAIIGGESGPNARTCDTAFIESLISDCQDAGVAIFIKQLGTAPLRDGLPIHLDSRKGGDWSEWPAHLRIREFADPREFV